MVEIISYKMCAVQVRNAKLRNYLKLANVACQDCKQQFFYDIALVGLVLLQEKRVN
jgi:hypothetical protein